jgi:hypothetical protein
MNGYKLIKQIMALIDPTLCVEMECSENTFQNGHVFTRFDGYDWLGKVRYIYRCNICGLKRDGSGINVIGAKESFFHYCFIDPDTITCDEFIIKQIIE